jgi:uncharacterized protein
MAKIEIMHVSTGQQLLQMQVDYVDGMTVQQALDTSGFLVKYPELNGFSVGVFSKPVSLDAVLRPDDRLEIYRPLLISPMEKRRQRAKKKD